MKESVYVLSFECIILYASRQLVSAAKKIYSLVERCDEIVTTTYRSRLIHKTVNDRKFSPVSTDEQ